MNIERINEVIDKIPITLIMGLYLGYLGFDYYNFINDVGSSLNLKQQEVTAEKTKKIKLEEKIKELNLFVKTLEQKKTLIRGLAQELETTKGSLPESLDVPGVMKMIVTEAKRVGLNVKSLTPSTEVQKEFYIEQPFLLSFTGIYPQVLVFLERLSNITEIVRIDTMNIAGSDSKKDYVQLSGSMEIKLYRYRGTSADKVGSKAAQ